MQEQPPHTRSLRKPPLTESVRLRLRSSGLGPLAALILAHADEVLERWRSGRPLRGGTRDQEVDELLARFQEIFVSMIPPALGTRRPDLEPLWASAAELYGSMGAMRGLAAGEVVEEFQGLRDALIRVLYPQLADATVSRISVRELLDLNQLMDIGVTRASVGYTDALYFSWLRGTGIPEVLTAEVREDIGSELASLARELESITAVGGG